MKFMDEEQILIIPIPPQIEIKDPIKDLVVVDQKCLKVVQTHYKEAIEKAFLTDKKKRIYKKKKKPQQLIVLPITNYRINENRIFYLYAGIVLPCDFSYEARIGIEDRMSFLQSCRPLVNIEKRQNYSLLSYSYNFKGLENFEFLIDIYQRKGKQNYYNLAQILKQFQSNIQLWKKQSQLLAPSRLSNPDLYNLKYADFVKECLKKVDQLDQSKFYVFGFIMYNYETDNLEQKTVGFSKGMLSLFGTDQDQFNNIVLRCGENGHTAGEALINSLIISLLPLACSSLIYQKSAAESVLITFDGFQIPYKEIRSYHLPEDNQNLGYFEIGFGLVEYDVSITVLQQLLTLRAKRYYIDKNKDFENISDETFEYSMNSQLFIEKFYPEAITNEFLRCRYKYLSEQDQQAKNVEIITSVQQDINIFTSQYTNTSTSQTSNPHQQKQQQQQQQDTTRKQYDSFLDISDYSINQQMISHEDVDNIIKNIKQPQMQLPNQNFMDSFNYGNQEGLGYSSMIESSSFNNQQGMNQQQFNSIDQQQQNKQLSSHDLPQIEMYIEPFQYFESNYDSESTADPNNSQKQSISNVSIVQEREIQNAQFEGIQRLGLLEQQNEFYNNDNINNYLIDRQENEFHNDNQINKDNKGQRVFSYRVQVPNYNQQDNKGIDIHQQSLENINFAREITDTLNSTFNL